MDKLKESLGPIYRHRFWIGCCAIVVLCTGIWLLEVMRISNEDNTRSKEIQDKFADAKRLETAGITTKTNARVHPNQKIHEETERIIRGMTKSVGEAWEKLYSGQIELFKWPDRLPQAFHDEVKKKLERPRWLVTYEGTLYTIQEEMTDDSQRLTGAKPRDYARKDVAIQALAEQVGVSVDEVNQKLNEKDEDGNDKVTMEYRPYRLPIEVAVSFDASAKPHTPDSEEIVQLYREIYRDFIQKQLPELADIVGANWNPGERNSAGAGAADGPNANPFGQPQPRLNPRRLGANTNDESEEPFVVAWSRPSQTYILNKLSVFEGSTGNVPSTLQMLYAQEDLWVMESIMRIIKETNNDQNDPKILPHDLAPIKQIISIEIGAEASKLGGSIQRSAVAAAGPVKDGQPVGPQADPGIMPGQDAGAPGTGAGPVPGGADPFAMGGDGMNKSLVKDPGDGRYVDLEYKPLLATDLRASYEEKDPEKAKLAVAKRMPVRLVLMMDQRKLPILIAACGNSHNPNRDKDKSRLPIEIRQVRINKHGNASGRSSGGNQDRNQVNPGVVPPGQLNPGFLGRQNQTAQRNADTTSRGKFDIPVELFGVVYIYNPVAVEILQAKEENREEEAAVAEGTPSATP